MHNSTMMKLYALAVTTALNCASTLSSADETQHKLPVLTQENGRFTVFDPSLKEHTFTQQPNGAFTADASSGGTLVHLTDQHYRWIDSRGLQHRFEGSHFAGLEPGTGALECPASDYGGVDSSPEVTEPAKSDEQTHDITDEAANEHETQCDTQSQGTHTFTTPAHGQAHTLLDARPQSCQSYFVQYYGTKRGSEIESGLHLHDPYRNMTPTLRTFPVIDFIDDNTFYAVHSRDLGNRTFNSPTRPQALLNKLLKDGEEIQTRFIDVLERDGSITASELGQSTTISVDELRPVTLQLIVRDGMASASHWQQIAEARTELQARYGITLDVIVIP